MRRRAMLPSRVNVSMVSPSISPIGCPIAQNTIQTSIAITA